MFLVSSMKSFLGPSDDYGVSADLPGDMSEILS
jgi:hypothetical protein